MPRYVSSIVLVLMGLVVLGCARKPADPVAQITQVIESVESAVEAGDLSAFKDHIAPTYRDAKGYDKSKLVGMLQFQVLRKRSVHLFTRIEGIEVHPNGAQGEAEVLIAAGSTPIAGIDALASVRADVLRVEVSFAKDDDTWIVVGADWRRASRGEFFDDDEDE